MSYPQYPSYGYQPPYQGQSWPPGTNWNHQAFQPPIGQGTSPTTWPYKLNATVADAVPKDMLYMVPAHWYRVSFPLDETILLWYERIPS